jgi:hypothetical protein
MGVGLHTRFRLIGDWAILGRWLYSTGGGVICSLCELLGWDYCLMMMVVVVLPADTRVSR